jgi:hypothetical protein
MHLGLTQDGLLIIYPDKFELVDLRSGESHTATRISIHPRSIVGDFFEVENELKVLLDSVFPSKFKTTRLVVCLKGQDSGGYTTIEIRAARELAYGAGAKEIHMANRVINSQEANDVFSGRGQEYINKSA